MRSLNIKYTSDILSVLIHVVILGLFISNVRFEKIIPEEAIEVEIGEPGGGSGGASPAPIQNTPSPDAEKSYISSKPEKVTVSETKRDIPSRTNPPVASEDRIPASRESRVSKEATVTHNSNAKGTNHTGVVGRGGEGTNPYGTGIGNGWGYGSGNGNGNGNGQGDGVGNGYSIDFGGRIRKIYSYSIPKYPDGVNKQADIKIRFSIKPDGSVGNIIVLTKADRRLESAAVNSLRRWRFAPLKNNQHQTEQSVVIVFPFRLD